MASPAPGEQSLIVQIGQKRKRDDEETDVKHEVKNETQDEKKVKTKDEDVEDDNDATVDINTLVPDGYEREEDNNDDGNDDSDEENENVVEDSANHPKHDESDEPFPACAYYDEAIEDLNEKLTSIAERIHDVMEEHDSSSAVFAVHKGKAEDLSKFPITDKMRIAILGGAGAGKSSLLNAVTGKHDLAKSVRFLSAPSRWRAMLTYV
jgi:ABC-type glutathione transport system ATPase component